MKTYQLNVRDDPADAIRGVDDHEESGFVKFNLDTGAAVTARLHHII